MGLVDVQWIEVFSFITFESVIYLLVGLLLGVVLGAIPGLTASVGMAVALPFTMTMEVVPALSLLAGIYKGGMFGGAIAAIGFGVPGTPSSAPTVFDGFELTKRGLPRRAMETAHYSGVASDVTSDIVLILSFAPVAAFALNIGPRELFALLLVAVALLAIFISEDMTKGLVALGLGFFIASMGTDPIGAAPRFTFGIDAVRGGIGLIPLLVGLFAVSEVMEHVRKILSRRLLGADETGHAAQLRFEKEGIRVREWFSSTWRETFLGAALGTTIGAIPGPGATLASFTSYGIAGRMKRNRGEFGKGSIRGVAAAEAADSATAGSTLIPLFGLGIPGSAMAALFAAALMLQGITPGPTMLQAQGEVVYAFFIMLMVGSLALLVIVHPLIPLFARLASLPSRILAPMLGALAVIGVYISELRLNSVLVMLVAGVLGYVLRFYGIPLGGVVMAFIIGPIFEGALRRTLLISDGNVWYFFEGWIAIGLYILGLITAVGLLFTKSKIETVESDSADSTQR